MILARLPLRQVALRSRLAAPSRSAHGEYQHIPFEYKNKRTFGLKVFAYLFTGAAIPVVATIYQLKKSGGSN